MKQSAPPSETRSEAAAWLARIRAEDCSEEDQRIFQLWLAEDPDHAHAFEAVSAMWETMGAVPREGHMQHDLRGRETQPVTHRRQVLAGAGALAVAGGTFSFWRSAQAEVYQTEVGEQKHVVLSDRTRIFLDTDTRVKISFTSKLRQAELDYGRANFNVAADSKRPFWVEAAERRILAGDATLDVRREGDKVSVVVIHGSAAVSPAGGERPKVLSGGERLSGEAHPTLDRPNMTPLLAWQTGRAIFDNERLSIAINEMNRYSTMKLAINGRGVGDMRISGVYSVGDNVSFASSVSKLLPVKVVQTNDRIEFVPDPGRPTRG